MSGRKGFFGSLYDFSFSSFIFPRLVRFLYAVCLILVTIGALGALVGALAGGDFLRDNFDFELPGWTALIIVPVAYFIYIILLRIWFEMIYVLFGIYENTGRIADRGGV